jgi:ABC-type dipeptide/oligopeptide/nickel transport system ATPase component
MSLKDEFIELVGNSTSKIIFHREIAAACESSQEIIELHDKLINLFELLKKIVEESDLSYNYINQFQNDITQAMNLFPYKDQQSLEFIGSSDIIQLRLNISTKQNAIEHIVNQIQFNFDFFNKLGFFRDNVVAIGANGSGKTSLSNDLKKYLTQNGVVISAQKVLLIPTFSGISNSNMTAQKLQTSQIADKSLKTTYTTENNGNAYHILVQLGGEFQVLLDNLLAERSAIINGFCNDLKKGGTDIKVPTTKLDIALEIWNKLIQHRTIHCVDGINITLESIQNASYPAFQMSDGEKVVLYFIAQVLQAPQSGFIIVDEPEMYLHKTILTKLWDRLERERQDCIFIYLTHDLDFAVSRTRSKKVWIKSFSYPDKWEIESIPENDVPEALLMELLGSRKNILFCEGKNKSLDTKIYSTLFPEYTISPVDSCFDVIHFTKSFNRIPNITTKAFGIIDADHHGQERLKRLEADCVFSFSMAEIENLFFDEKFLGLLASQLLKEDDVIENIKLDVLALLENDIELQIANYISTKINYYFKNSHVSKGNSKIEVETNYSKFTGEIKLEEWYLQRKSELQDVIKTKDYIRALQIYNNKGLRTVGNKHFKISDFTERALKLLDFNIKTHAILLSHFPTQLQM